MYTAHSWPPILNGLILAGGYSSRMGRDKSMLDFHGQPQYSWLHALMSAYLPDVYLSCRKDQVFPDDIPLIRDEVQDQGPMSGVIAAMRKHPERAWMVIACDMPYIDAAVIETLIAKRDPWKYATCFSSAQNAFPEPLLSIYEPSVMPLLQSHFESGRTSLSALLQECNETFCVDCEPLWLKSINTPEELSQFLLEEK